MKNNRIYMIVTLTALVALLAGTAIAGASAGKTDQTKSRQETIEGVLSLKEGHGDFLVRQPDGKRNGSALALRRMPISRATVNRSATMN